MTNNKYKKIYFLDSQQGIFEIGVMYKKKKKLKQSHYFKIKNLFIDTVLYITFIGGFNYLFFKTGLLSLIGVK